MACWDEARAAQWLAGLFLGGLGRAAVAFPGHLGVWLFPLFSCPQASYLGVPSPTREPEKLQRVLYYPLLTACPQYPNTQGLATHV